MNTITIEGQLRTEFGKRATRAVRSQEQVPAVIYGGAKEVNFSAPAKSFKNLVYTDKFQLVEISVDGQKYKAIMKDLQFDRVSDKLIHVDFLELSDDKKVVANLPIKFTGSAVGVKAGGKFVAKLQTLKVKTLPKHLKEAIEVDVTNLELNGNLRVEDVKEPDFEIMNSPRIPIASIVLTRQLKQAASAEAKK
ncbi:MULTISPECIES: 50S ribosomal protein L25 [Chitinophagaceae]